MTLACSGYRGSRVIHTECRGGNFEGTGMIGALPFRNNFVVKACTIYVPRI